jgi:hypothetical protein
MHKLSELIGQNERVSGGILFSFDVEIQDIPVEREQELYNDLMKLFGRALSAVESQLPTGVSIGVLDMEDTDTVYEDDYDRFQSINENL